MKLLLVSGRDGGRGLRMPEARVAGAANALAERGHAVRWLQPRPAAGGRPAGLADAVVHREIVSPAPPFRAVQARGSDPPTEAALAGELRAELPDWTVCLDHGGATSRPLSWVVKSMGGRVAVHVDPRSSLCHRGTLVDWRGEECRIWDDPARCARCCRQPFAGGLGPLQAALAKACRVLRAWSPFPESHQFRFRLDYVLHTLELADLLLVEADADRELLAAAGPRRRVCTLGSLAAVDDVLGTAPARASRRG